MKSIPAIKAVMTPFPHWVPEDAALEQAAEMMRRHDVRHLPVMRDGRRIVGLLTDRELRRFEPSWLVRDVCSSTAYVVDLHEPLDRVLERMASRHLDATLVVKDDKLVGIFTWVDACDAFAGLLRSLFPAGGDDAA